MCIRDSIENEQRGAHRDGAVRDVERREVVLVPVDVDEVDDCLLYTSDAADERSSVDLGGRRIIKKKKRAIQRGCRQASHS